MPRRRQQDRHLPEGMYLNGKTYRLRIYIDGKPGWRYLGKDLDAALIDYARIKQLSQFAPLATVFTRYRDEELPKKAPKTQRGQLPQLELLNRVFGHMRPEDIRQQDAIAYLDARAKKGAPIAGNREIALLRHVLTKCCHWGMLERNPLLGLNYRNTERPRDRILTAAEIWRTMHRAPDYMRHAIWIGYLTGLRREDVLRLTRFNAKEDGLHVTEGKTGKRVIILWSKSLRRVIDKRISGSPDQRLFTISESGFDTAWQRLMAKQSDRWQFKDLRAKHAQDIEDQGGNATTQLDHSSRAVTRRHYLRAGRTIRPIR